MSICDLKYYYTILYYVVLYVVIGTSLRFNKSMSHIYIYIALYCIVLYSIVLHCILCFKTSVIIILSALFLLIHHDVDA